MWDVETGRETLTLKGHTAQINSITFSHDGQRIVTGSGYGDSRGELKVWDAQTPQDTLTLKGHSREINSLAISPDGKQIATGSLDHTAKVWDAETGAELRTLKGHAKGVNSIAISPDGRTIVTGSYDAAAKIWNAQDGREILALKGHTDNIKSAAFSPDGQCIVTASEDGTVKMWEAQTGRETLMLAGHEGRVSSVAFSPDGQRIVSGGEGFTAKLWSTGTGREIATILKGYQGHYFSINSVAFSPDGKRIVTGSDDNKARLWDTQTGTEVLTLRGHAESIHSVAFSPNGKQVLTGSEDKTAKIWDTETGRELLTLKGFAKSVNSAVFSPDGHSIITASGSQIDVWFSDSGHWTGVMKDTNQVSAHLSLAETLVRARQYREAVTAYKAALYIRPAIGNATFLSNLGRYEYLAGQIDDAIKSSRHALEKDPKLTYLRLNVGWSDWGWNCTRLDLGLYYATLNDWPRAKHEYDLALQVAPEDSMKSGIEDIRTAIKTHTTPALAKLLVYLQQRTVEADAHLTRAKNLVKAKKYAEAVAEYKEVARLRPNDAPLLGNLGWYEYLAGWIDDAIKTSRRALEKDSALTYVRLNLGLSYAALDDWPHAKQEYDLALKSMPKDTLKPAIDDIQVAIKKRDNPALEKALVYLQKVSSKRSVTSKNQFPRERIN